MPYRKKKCQEREKGGVIGAELPNRGMGERELESIQRSHSNNKMKLTEGSCFYMFLLLPNRKGSENVRHILTDLFVGTKGKPQVILIASHARSNVSSFPILGR
jgi:hypothetical protein